MGDGRDAALEEIRSKRWKMSRKLKGVSVMAKKETKNQQTIEGAVDQPSRKVRDAARKLAKVRYLLKKLGKDQEVLKPALDVVMAEESVEKLEVSFEDEKETIRYEVKREDPGEFKITCKKLGGDSE